MGIGNIIGGIMGANASKDAANVQAQAANQASANQMAMYNQTRADLLPYNQQGQSALTTLQGQMPSLTAAFQPTEAQLEATPGYQFTLNQGLQGVQNAASAKGLGVSGAALKGAANYATGLADNTYMDQANLYYTGQNNAYNKLMGIAQLGENAAATTGAQGTQAANNAGNYLTSGANARASGIIGSTNALTNGINGFLGNANQAAMLMGGF